MSSHMNHHTHNNETKVHSSTPTHWIRKDWNNWQSKTCMKCQHITALHHISPNRWKIRNTTFGRMWTKVTGDCCHHHSNILCEELNKKWQNSKSIYLVYGLTKVGPQKHEQLCSRIECLNTYYIVCSLYIQNQLQVPDKTFDVHIKVNVKDVLSPPRASSLFNLMDPTEQVSYFSTFSEPLS
jgi:hypothetical protein